MRCFLVGRRPKSSCMLPSAVAALNATRGHIGNDASVTPLMHAIHAQSLTDFCACRAIFVNSL